MTNVEISKMKRCICSPNSSLANFIDGFHVILWTRLANIYSSVYAECLFTAFRSAILNRLQEAELLFIPLQLLKTFRAFKETRRLRACGLTLPQAG